MSACATCHQRLTLDIEYDEEMEDDQFPGRMSTDQGTQTLPDDVELRCGCHFHWQCLLDAYQISQCPNCGRTVTSTMGGQQQVLCNLNNEGGLQENLDILPILSEESYLKAYPEERKCRAFLEFCKEGDVEAIVDLLNDDDEVDDGNDNDGTDGVDGVVEAVRMNAANILRYQDPIGSMASGLHLAVMNGVVEVIWLLLLLASNLELDEFPTEVRTTAEQMGVIREDQSGKTDIRALKDSNGMTAEEVASGTAWGSPFDLTLLRP